MAANTDYVATEDLFVAYGVRAFYKGATVPADNEHLAKWQEQGKVAKATTKAAKEAQAE